MIDPRDGLARYIGVTKNSLQKRLNQHLSEAKGGHKNWRCNWIRKLVSLNLLPIIKLVEAVSDKKREEREKYWISVYGRENLVNGTDGGEGVQGHKYTPDDIYNMSMSHKGKIPWNKGISTEISHLKKYQFKKGGTRSNKGVACSIETRQKASNAKADRKYSGVSYQNKPRKWVAQIKYLGINYYIGCFDTESDAAKAYDIVWMHLSKTGSVANFPELEQEYKDFLENNQALVFVILRKKIKKLLKNGGLYYGI